MHSISSVDVPKNVDQGFGLGPFQNVVQGRTTGILTSEEYYNFFTHRLTSHSDRQYSLVGRG